jgi:methylenetetrahydrofolate reductase (NADPH)
LKEKMDCGADFIVTQFFYDADKFLQYVDSCRIVGISCPIIPGIMPIQSYTTLIKMTQYCGVAIPSSVLERLEAINKNDDEAVKLLGCDIATEMCRQIYTKSNGEIDGVHFYTLNLERSVTEIVGMVELIKPIEQQHSTKVTTSDSPMDSNQRKISLTPPRMKDTEVRYDALIFPFCCMLFANVSLISQVNENAPLRILSRPINWANRPQSYAMRTETWDEFPNGRWGDSRSPAFGELSDMSHFYSYSLGTIAEHKAILGDRPETPQDIYNVFVRYVEGRIPNIPWCETSLQPESLLIQRQLIELNSNGFMTINSQPAVNGKPSDDEVFGWGGAGGYVYQKEYCEFFCSPSHFQSLLDAFQQHPSMNLFAVDASGTQIHKTSPGSGVTALTWGVFPNREIVQPTIFDPNVFLIWAQEAFSLWNVVWRPLYEEGSVSRTLIETIHNSYFLVAVIDNDFVMNKDDAESQLCNIMLESINKASVD